MRKLLASAIFFDFRAIAGATRLADTLRAEVVESARRTPRFLKQLGLNALQRAAPLNWRGAVDTDAERTLHLPLVIPNRNDNRAVDASRLCARRELARFIRLQVTHRHWFVSFSR